MVKLFVAGDLYASAWRSKMRKVLSVGQPEVVMMSGSWGGGEGSYGVGWAHMGGYQRTGELEALFEMWICWW